MLEKREKHLQVKIDRELKVAKENAQKNKRGNFFSPFFISTKKERR